MFESPLNACYLDLKAKWKVSNVFALSHNELTVLGFLKIRRKR